MAILTGFTRPVQGDTNGNPIVADDLRTWVANTTGLTLTYIEIHPNSIDVTGTVVSGNMTAIQTAINAYVYAQSINSPYALAANLSNVNPMLDDSTKFVTSHAALTSDNAVLALARRKAWVTGVLKQDSFVYYSKATTTSGTVTFYITDDGTASGNAVFTNVYADSITISPYGTAAVYQISAPTVASDKKSITATVNQVTSVVLGLIQITAAANSVQCNMLVLGD